MYLSFGFDIPHVLSLRLSDQTNCSVDVDNRKPIFLKCDSTRLCLQRAFFVTRQLVLSDGAEEGHQPQGHWEEAGSRSQGSTGSKTHAKTRAKIHAKSKDDHQARTS